MKHVTAQPYSSTRMAALGFSGGAILALAYATLFLVYGSVRLMMETYASVAPPHRAQTLFLLVMSLMLTVVVFAALMAILAGSIGALTALVAHGLRRWLPVHAALIGTSTVVSIALNLIFYSQSGANLATIYLPTYLFWFGLPTVVYMLYSVRAGFILRRSSSLLDYEE